MGNWKSKNKRKSLDKNKIKRTTLSSPFFYAVRFQAYTVRYGGSVLTEEELVVAELPLKVWV